MTNSDFGSRIRAHRSSGAVLKVKVSNIRSRNRSAVIAVVEGVTDIGPYEVWIGQIEHDLKIEFAPAAGKSQVLDFRRRMQGDQSGLAGGIYMFVDRDFDGLRGQRGGDDIFCTASYSIENYFVSEAILRSILTDEFQCTAETTHREEIVELFADLFRQFIDCIRDANRRIYQGRRLGLLKANIDDKISKYVDISHSRVRKMYDEKRLAELLVFDREPFIDETESIDAEFEALDPLLSYRGKFVLAFFLVWLVKIGEEGKRSGQTVFPSTARVRFSPTSLTLRSLATRSALPCGLEIFVRNMKGPVSGLVA